MPQFIKNILLTKEEMSAYIYDLRKQQAAEYGLTLDEYMLAIQEGRTVIPQIKLHDTTNESRDETLS